MDLTYLGAGSVRISGKNIAIICDPYGPEAGLGDIKATANVVLATDLDNVRKLGDAMVLEGPGEYEVRGVMITGIPARRHIDADGKQGTIYRLTVEGFVVAFLGNVAPELSNEQLEALGQVDVLVVPVGGNGLTLDAVAATEMVNKIEPKFVVPTHYDDGRTKYAMPQDKLDDFLKEIGASPEPQTKLKLSNKDLPLETTVVRLERA